MASKLWLGVVVLTSNFIVAPIRADMPAAIARVKPSVVIVGTFGGLQSPRFSLRGTGFVVSQGGAGSSNLVITNAHVLPLPVETDPLVALAVQVRNKDALQMRTARVLDIDQVHDLALLRFEGPAVAALMVGDSDLVREGQTVAFMGFPIGAALGFSPVTHRAMVSSIAAAALPIANAQQLNEKSIRSLRGGASFPVFQLDGTAYPGNSGGPLFDPVSGEVLGVVNMVLVKGTRESALTHPSGISYAIPAGYVQQLLARGHSR